MSLSCYLDNVHDWADEEPGEAGQGDGDAHLPRVHFVEPPRPHGLDTLAVAARSNRRRRIEATSIQRIESAAQPVVAHCCCEVSSRAMLARLEPVPNGSAGPQVRVLSDILGPVRAERVSRIGLASLQLERVLPPSTSW